MAAVTSTVTSGGQLDSVEVKLRLRVRDMQPHFTVHRAAVTESGSSCPDS
jgi:hypothetical protein